MLSSETTQGPHHQIWKLIGPGLKKKAGSKWPGSSDRCWAMLGTRSLDVFQERYEFHFWILPGLEHGLGISLGSLGPTLSCQPQFLWGEPGRR